MFIREMVVSSWNLTWILLLQVVHSIAALSFRDLVFLTLTSCQNTLDHTFQKF